jgi:hypothetical protein
LPRSGLANYAQVVRGRHRSVAGAVMEHVALAAPSPIVIVDGLWVKLAYPTTKRLALQVFKQRTLLVHDEMVRRVSYKLVSAPLTVMILLTMIGIAIFLYRFDPHSGPASLTTMAAVGLSTF